MSPAGLCTLSREAAPLRGGLVGVGVENRRWVPHILHMTTISLAGHLPFSRSCLWLPEDDSHPDDVLVTSTQFFLQSHCCKCTIAAGDWRESAALSRPLLPPPRPAPGPASSSDWLARKMRGVGEGFVAKQWPAHFGHHSVAIVARLALPALLPGQAWKLQAGYKRTGHGKQNSFRPFQFRLCFNSCKIICPKSK